MTVYNTAFALVKRAIDSVLLQDYNNFELIVADDGSHIELSKRLLNYCQQYPEKITYLRHQNCGQSASVNRAVKLSTGVFISIIDSDDEYKPAHLSSCLNEMQETDLLSSFTETIVNTEEDHFVPDKDDHRKTIHVDDCILFATLFGRKEVFEKLKFKNMYAADAEFYAKAAGEFRVKKANLRTYIYYRNMEGSLSATLKKAQLAIPQLFG